VALEAALLVASLFRAHRLSASVVAREDTSTTLAYGSKCPKVVRKKTGMTGEIASTTTLLSVRN